MHNKYSFEGFNNTIYEILRRTNRTRQELFELNGLLKSEGGSSIELDGLLLHFLTETAQACDDISWRMVYALSNAGLDVNVCDSRGNTALHLAYMRGYTEIGFNFIEALLKVGTDLSIKNLNNKQACYYMENIQQLNSMYAAHSPGIWTAVNESKLNDLQRLINAWVKCTAKRGRQDLLTYADQVATKKDRKVQQLLKTNCLMIEYAHSLCALDVERMQSLLNSMEMDRFESNLADYSYCYSWYRPTCRNLPKFLLELALDTNITELINSFLELKPDVNLLHSITGAPLYFAAFETEHRHLKTKLTYNANWEVKNQHGESVLFHLVELYLIAPESSVDYKRELVNDFVKLMNEHPLLITKRNGQNQTLVERIMFMNADDYKRSTVFLKQIGRFLVRLVEEKKFDVFQEMIYQSYGLILLNTPLFIDYSAPIGDEKSRQVDNDDDDNDVNISSSTTTSRQDNDDHDELPETITFEQFIVCNEQHEIKVFMRKFFESNYLKVVDEFQQAIRFGDLTAIKKFLASEKNYFLLRIRDPFGRSCLHLATLYNHKSIVKLFSQLDANLLKSVDNLNRTVLHYAYCLPDDEMLKLVNSYKINKSARDCKYLLAEEYQLDEVRADELFGVKNFRQTQDSTSQNHQDSFVQCFIYRPLKSTIERRNLDELKSIHFKLKFYNLSIKHLPLGKRDHQFVCGEEYTPPIELAFKLQCFSIFSYLLEMYYESMMNVSGAATPKTLTSMLRTTVDKSEIKRRNEFKVYLNELRERAEDAEMHEIIDILDNFEEDREIAAITSTTTNDLDVLSSYIEHNVKHLKANFLSLDVILENKSVKNSRKASKQDCDNESVTVDDKNNNQQQQQPQHVVKKMSIGIERPSNARSTKTSPQKNSTSSSSSSSSSNESKISSKLCTIL